MFCTLTAAERTARAPTIPAPRSSWRDYMGPRVCPLSQPGRVLRAIHSRWQGSTNENIDGLLRQCTQREMATKSNP
jgi:hypothetical protein